MLATTDPTATSRLRGLADVPGREGRLVHTAELPPRQAIHGEWPDWVHREVVEAFDRAGVARPWTHQVTAADLAHSGHDVVLATGTASGKSLAYLAASLSEILDRRAVKEKRGATAVYLAPTKALAHDQFAALEALGTRVRAGTHDGDSSVEQRDWNRDHAEYLLTNPDMLHRSLLPRHQRWSSFFAKLSYVVVDECHHYRGVFGAHVSHVLRRLLRIAARYGAFPRVILASATVSEPETSASRLVGRPVVAVTDDASPRGEVALGLWEPPFTGHRGAGGELLRRSATAEISDLMADLVGQGVRTLSFVKSRRGSEHVAASTASKLAEVDPSLSTTVAAYRGGYLPEERRELERAIRAGDLLGLAATNALELGIDVSGLDAVLLAGFPGTRAAMWQQIGRAGREAQSALGILVANDDPLDSYLINHPEALLDAPVEANVFDPGNPHVLAPHLCAAAEEFPLTEADLDLFDPAARTVVDQLTDAGLLRRRAQGWYWTDRRAAAQLTDIRGVGGSEVSLIESSSGRVVGTVDEARALSSAYPGAVYLHRGEGWVIDSLDLVDHVAHMAREDVDYFTTATSTTDITIEATTTSTMWGPCTVSTGSVVVSSQVTSFQRRRKPDGSVLSTELLDLPSTTLNTAACWWQVPGKALQPLVEVGVDLPGAAHAAEHCSIGLLPLFATCDRWDIGGVSTALHLDTGELTVFVHDGQPGGAGFARRGFDKAPEWLRATRETIASCSCEHGCPSCIQSPKCGNGNNPLDKSGAVLLLDVLLAGAPD